MMRRETFALFFAAAMFSLATVVTLHQTMRERRQQPSGDTPLTPPSPPASLTFTTRAGGAADGMPPPPPPPLPRVTIITLSRGQRHCERNSILNALYQTYPHDRLTLLIGDTSEAPSTFYRSWATPPDADADDARAPWRALGVAYRWCARLRWCRRRIFSFEGSEHVQARGRVTRAPSSRTVRSARTARFPAGHAPRAQTLRQV